MYKNDEKKERYLITRKKLDTNIKKVKTGNQKKLVHKHFSRKTKHLFFKKNINLTETTILLIT